MTFQAALRALDETALPDRVGAKAAARVALVGDVARDMHAVERLLAERIDGGIAPGRQAAKHLFDAGGKRIRPLALMLACRCFGPITARARDLAAAAELVHMATLLHDDVIDDGDLRRGRPTSRRIWGNAVSVLAGDLLLVEALRLAAASHTATWTELVATLGRLVDGEIIQLRGRSEVSLSEATYFEIVHGKTASLFEWALRAGAREGGASDDAVAALGRFGTHLGVAFQLVDDVLDYDGEGTGKTMFADLAEGKMTLPLLRAGRGIDLAPIVARIREGDERAAEDLAATVRASGACEEVRELAREETRRAAGELAAVPPCRARDVLEEVASSLAARLS